MPIGSPEQLDRIARWGLWAFYEPTISGSGSAKGDGVCNGYVRRDGSLLNYRIRFTLGATSTIGGSGITFSLPTDVTAVVETDQFQCAAGVLRETGVAEYLGILRVTSGSAGLTAYAVGVGGTYATLAAVLTAVPFTWGSTDVMSFTGVCEVAPPTYS
jgi:hypothetical protein